MIKFKDTVYNVDYFVLHTSNYKRAIKTLKHYLNLDFNEEDFTSVAFTQELVNDEDGVRRGILFVFNEDIIEYKTLVHETFHAMVMLSRKIAMPIEDKNDEAFAYYQEWLFNRLTTILKRKVKL